MLTIECQVTKSRHTCNRVWVITVKGLSIECEVTKSKQALLGSPGGGGHYTIRTILYDT